MVRGSVVIGMRLDEPALVPEGDGPGDMRGGEWRCTDSDRTLEVDMVWSGAGWRLLALCWCSCGPQLAGRVRKFYVIFFM